MIHGEGAGVNRRILREGSDMSEEEARRGIQSVEAAFRLLDALRGGPLPLRDIAARAAMTRSAANNYLVSLVRTGLAAAEEKAGHYRLGPAAVSLGMAAVEQIDGFAILRREATALRDATGHNAAVSAWTADGPVSLFTQQGNRRAAVELRTGLLSMSGTAAGRLFAACLSAMLTGPVFDAERGGERLDVAARAGLAADVEAELDAKGFCEVRRRDGTGYASAAAPVRDWSGGLRFALSLIGSQDSLDLSPGSEQTRALIACAARAAAALGWSGRAGDAAEGRMARHGTGDG
jgi:DNA-binding IclR family transcriptional regulator